MKGIKYILAAVVVAALLVVGAVAWLAGTAEGARWLLKTVSNNTPLKIRARDVEGRLLDHLRLAGVRLSLPQQEVEVESLDLRWQALLLLNGRVAVEELSLRGVLVRDNAPPSKRPPDLTWPHVSGTAALIAGRIDRLRVDGFGYRHADREPLDVAHLSASLSWRDGNLAIKELKIDSASGRLAGALEAGFLHPSLRLDLNVIPAHSVAEMDSYSLKGNLLQGHGPEQLAGNVEAAGASISGRRVVMAAEVGMTRDTFNLRRLRLSESGRKGTVSGEGSIRLTATEPSVKLRLKLDGLDLARELKVPASISGALTFEGNPSSYRGRLDLANRGKGWQTARLAGIYQGTAMGMELAQLNGAVLGGTLSGKLDVGWRDGFSLNGTLHGRNLDPARLSPDWQGVVNLDLAGNLARSGTAPLRGRVSGTLLESRLHGRALTGDLQADLADNNLRIGRLALQGKGFTISAAGELNRRLTFSARISDLSRLVPGAGGELASDGWLRRRAGLLSGSAAAKGSNLAAGKARIGTAELTAGLAEGRDYPLHVSAALRNVLYGRFLADSATLEASGTALRHTLDASLHSSGAELGLALSGTYRAGSWQGEITRLTGRDSMGPWASQGPATLTVTTAGITLSPLVLNGVRTERIEVAGDMRRRPLGGFARVRWEGLNLARAGYWLKDAAVTGTSSGNAQVNLLGEDRLSLSGSATATGTLTVNGRRIGIRHGSLDLDWNEHGLQSALDLELAETGRLRGAVSSSEPARPALPGKLEAAVEWQGIDTALLRPWLPPSAHLDGRLSGNMAMTLLPEQRLELRGSSSLAGGKASWQSAEGEMNVELRNAGLTWIWQGETLRGDLALTLADYGQVRGNFQLPLPARLPASLNPQGPLQASLTGQVREKGLLTALFPGFIQESHGDIDLDLRAAGRWEEPLLSGELRLAKAGAYLPRSGIHVKDVQLTAKLERDAVRIEAFRAVSGPGRIEGTAVVQLKKWQVTGYKGTVNGERFQLAFLPELQLLASPRLTFEGSPEKLSVRGEVRLPELIVTGPPARTAVEPSSDVVIVDAPLAKKASAFDLDLQIAVILGDRVLIKLEGIDAQLGGRVDLKVRGPERIASSGEIKVVKGRYKTYGINLDIERGRVFYSGGSISQPTLDILALRTVNDVRAGVTVGGTPRAPVVKLYSEPAMPDVDILAYIVLGHPLGSSGEQAGLVARAAGFLLSSGQSVVLQDQIKNRLGLSTLELQTGGTGTADRMGYKPIAVTPPGMAPQPATGGLSQAMVTVGKYLTPKLYVSYGQSVFTRSNLIRLKYEISRRWEVETQTGTESGADLYYKIDFN